MARTNKYASLNFNDIYEKKTTTSNTHNHSSSSSLSSPNNKNKTILSNSRIHGNMLVLTRPSPKPIPIPIPQPSPPSPTPDQTRIEKIDSISLRPLGRTGSGSSLVSSALLTSPLQSKGDKDLSLSVSPKPNRFVPPHLRPGFLGREEKPGPDLQKQPGARAIRQGHIGSPHLYEEDGRRPKSGGGYDQRMRRGFESDPVEMNRPNSSGGTRPSSRG